MSALATPAFTRATPLVYRVYEPLVQLQRGRAITDSLKIAKEFQRAHKNVLQS